MKEKIKRLRSIPHITETQVSASLELCEELGTVLGQIKLEKMWLRDARKSSPRLRFLTEDEKRLTEEIEKLASEKIKEELHDTERAA